MTSKAGPPHAGDNTLHVPVLLEECVNLLGPVLTAEAPVMIGTTLGMRGHSFAFLKCFANLMVVGIGRDPETIELVGERLARFDERFVTVRATYDDVSDVAAEYGRAGRTDTVLMDLDVSSLQLDGEGHRFSYSSDDPLGIRTDKTGGPTAADVLASANKAGLTRILRGYGEERFASRIAARIFAAHAVEPIERVGQLADIVRDVTPAPVRRTRDNSCKRAFWTPRIVVNDELALLRRAISRTIGAIAVGSRIAVESYQSLEDKTVKREMARGATSPTSAGPPAELDNRAPYFRLLTRGAAKADATKLQANPRNAPVRPRVAEKLRETPHTA